jgi:ABC-type ATPase involved in cell division
MRIRNKEHQSLGLDQLKELAYDFPNDSQLGEELRRIIKRATDNNPKGRRATSPTTILDSQIKEAHKILERDYEDNPSDIERDYEEEPRVLHYSPYEDI